MPDDTYILAGTYSGEVKMFDIQTTLEAASYNCHDSQINNMQVSRASSCFVFAYRLLSMLNEEYILLFFIARSTAMVAFC